MCRHRGPLAQLCGMDGFGPSVQGMVLSSPHPLGPVALDLIGMVLIVYAAVALVSTPVAVVSFRRRQVA